MPKPPPLVHGTRPEAAHADATWRTCQTRQPAGPVNRRFMPTLPSTATNHTRCGSVGGRGPGTPPPKFVAQIFLANVTPMHDLAKIFPSPSYKKLWISTCCDCDQPIRTAVGDSDCHDLCRTHTLHNNQWILREVPFTVTNQYSGRRENQQQPQQLLQGRCHSTRSVIYDLKVTCPSGPMTATSNFFLLSLKFFLGRHINF